MKRKSIIANLAVSVGAWLLFALLYSLGHEDAVFTQVLVHHMGLCAAISVVLGAYTSFMKEKA